MNKGPEVWKDYVLGTAEAEPQGWDMNSEAGSTTGQDLKLCTSSPVGVTGHVEPLQAVFA